MRRGWQKEANFRERYRGSREKNATWEGRDPPRRTALLQVTGQGGAGTRAHLPRDPLAPRVDPEGQASQTVGCAGPPLRGRHWLGRSCRGQRQVRPTTWHTGDPAGHPHSAGDPVLACGGTQRHQACRVDPRLVLMRSFLNSSAEKPDTWEGVEEKATVSTWKPTWGRLVSQAVGRRLGHPQATGFGLRVAGLRLCASQTSPGSVTSTCHA